MATAIPAKVAAINAAVGTKGYSVAPSVSSPSASAPVATSNVSTNPHDAPGYNPNTDPASTAFGKSVPTTASTIPNSQSVPTTPNPTTLAGNAQQTGTTQATPDQVNAVNQASSQIQSISDQIANKYKTANANLKASGVEAPDTGGAASTAIQANAPAIQQKPQVSPIDQQLAQDPAYQQIIADHQAYQSSVNQRESLTQTYTDLSNQLGIPALNTQLMNMKNVIDGTEDDIRNEVSKAGGFATDSQVQALATSRNKSLIQNYNNLLQTKNDATQQLSTMLSLTEQDRAEADKTFQNQTDFDTQMANYRDKFVSNAQNALSNMVQSEGWDGVYKAALASGDPTAIQRINSTMGQGFDIASVAQQAAQTRTTANAKTALDLQKENADIANTQANTANTRENILKTQGEINDTNGLPNPAKAGQPGYNDQGVKFNTSSAADEVKGLIQSQGWTGTRGLLAPNNYNYLKSWWVQQGLPDASFDSVFGGMRDPNIMSDTKKKTEYN